MGHFSMTCSISGLAITGGTPVRCLLLTASPYDEGDARSAWVVRTPPLRAVYNDYGSIEKIHEDDKFIADLWLRGLREDIVEKGLGDNCYHDLATPKDMTFEQLLDALRARRVEVVQDAEHFWRRPLDDSWMSKLKDEHLPFFKRIEKLVATAGEVSTDAAPNTYVVDEPVPNLVRVRFGKYQADEGRAEALTRAKEAVEKGGFVGVIAAGSGRYPDSADLLVLSSPSAQHHQGPQWDMAPGQSAAHGKKLAVRLAMVREDVWQALIEFPRSEYVGLDCIHCGQSPSYHDKGRVCPNEAFNNNPFKAHETGSRYEHGPVFPEGVEHVVVPNEWSDYVWFGLAAYKASVRKAWKSILAYFDRQVRMERGEKVEVEETKEEKALSPELEKLLAGYKAEAEAEAKRIAALPEEEQDKIKAERKERSERHAKARAERLENPIFGDYLITDFMFPTPYDRTAPGTWIFRHDVPGVLGIPEHLSMCLADKKEVPDFVIDRLAELAAFSSAMHDVGCVWKPAASTGPQDPEWKQIIRFADTLARIARKQQERYEEDDEDDEVKGGLLPTSLSEAIERFKEKK